MFDTHVQHLLSGKYSLRFLRIDTNTRTHFCDGLPAAVGTLQLGLVGELRSSVNYRSVAVLPSTLIDTERLVLLGIALLLLLSLPFSTIHTPDFSLLGRDLFLLFLHVLEGDQGSKVF